MHVMNTTERSTAYTSYIEKLVITGTGASRRGPDPAAGGLRTGGFARKAVGWLKALSFVLTLSSVPRTKPKIKR